MSIIDKSKILKNPARREPEQVKAYVPQYQLRGIAPAEYISPPLPKNASVSKGSMENPRLPHQVVRQPYAEIAPPLLGKVPNVGNNMEHSWSSLDGEIIDDITSEMELVDPEQVMIDNNDYVSAEALGLPEKKQEEPLDFSSFVSCMQSVQDNEYVLFVGGACLSCGSSEDIEKDVQSLIFGEHEMCEGKSVPAEEILVIKKVPIKIGVFLE